MYLFNVVFLYDEKSIEKSGYGPYIAGVLFFFELGFSVYGLFISKSVIFF